MTQDAASVQMKKVFSANPEATINVECLMNDIDVAGRLSRDIFEEKSASVLERARAPLQKVLLSCPSQCTVSPANIHVGKPVSVVEHVQCVSQVTCMDKHILNMGRGGGQQHSCLTCMSCPVGAGGRPDHPGRCPDSRGCGWKLPCACSAQDYQGLLWQGAGKNLERQGVCLEGSCAQLRHAQSHLQVSIHESIV